MGALEENNKMRIQQLGEVPASEMTKREKIAIEILNGLLSNPYLDAESVIDHAIIITDLLIQKLNK